MGFIDVSDIELQCEIYFWEEPSFKCKDKYFINIQWNL